MSQILLESERMMVGQSVYSALERSHSMVNLKRGLFIQPRVLPELLCL